MSFAAKRSTVPPISITLLPSYTPSRLISLARNPSSPSAPSPLDQDEAAPDKITAAVDEELERIPEWKEQITIRGLAVSAILGMLFCIITHKFNLNRRKHYGCSKKRIKMDVNEGASWASVRCYRCHYRCSLKRSVQKGGIDWGIDWGLPMPIDASPNPS